MEEEIERMIRERAKYAIDREIAERGLMGRQQVREVVRETLSALGFSEHPESVQRDMIYLKNLRRGSERTSVMIKGTTITVCVSAGLYLIWEAIRSAIRGD